MENQVGYGDSPVFMLVDLLLSFTDRENPFGGDLTGVVERTNTLIDAARGGDVPVVFTRIVSKNEGMRDMGVWGKKITSLETLYTDGAWVDIDPQLHLESDEHALDKRQASALHETELDLTLTRQLIDAAIITGCTTSGCIRASAVDACSHGCNKFVPEGAVGDRRLEPHEANLFDTNPKYGDVRPVEKTVDYLRHPESNPGHAEP